MAGKEWRGTIIQTEMGRNANVSDHVRELKVR